MHKVYGSYLHPEDEIYRNIVTYSVSDTHSLYLYELEDIQRVFVKGDNLYGQLGTKDYNSYYRLTELLVGLPESKIIKVWALTNASYILTEDGKLYAAGNNNRGKLGVETEENTVNVFTEVKLPEEAIGHITDVQGNGNFTIYKTDIGKFYASGDNTYGQLGLPETCGKASDVDGNPVIEIANNLTDEDGNPVVVKDMAAGKDFSVLIDNTQQGNLYFTGNNSGNPSNGMRQSSTDFLPDRVYGFTYVTSMHLYDTCGVHKEETNPHDFYILASDEIYAVLNGYTVDEVFKGFSFLFLNYDIGEKIYPEIYLFSPIFEDLDVSDYQLIYPGLYSFRSYNFEDVVGDNGVHGVRFGHFIKYEDGDFQPLQSLSDIKLLNEGILYTLKSRATKTSYITYFGKNIESSANYIPWIDSTDGNYIKSNVIVVNEKDNDINITKLVASSKTLMYFGNDGSYSAIFAAGSNLNGLIDPTYLNEFVEIGGAYTLNCKEENLYYPLYISDIATEENSFTVNIGEEKTITFNQINRPKIIVKATSNSEKAVHAIIDLEEIRNPDGILNGIKVAALSGGNVTISFCDNTEEETKLFEITVDVPEDVDYNIYFEDGIDTVVIGETLDVVFRAPTEYMPGIDFELRVNKSGVFAVSDPIEMGTDSGLTRYLVMITPLTPVQDNADLEIWILGPDAQCIVSKNIKVIEPAIEPIEIDFTPEMPNSIKKGEQINVTQYVTPANEATNMSYTVVSGNEYLVKVNPSIGTFLGVAEGVATIRINHPFAISYKDFSITVEAEEAPSEEQFEIQSIITSVNLKIGESASITFSTVPVGNEDKVIISSDNPQVCSVNQQNKTVTAVGVGTTYIRLSSTQATTPLLIPVTVTSEIVISAPQTMTVKKGETAQIPVSVSPESERQNIVFSANNLNVAVSQSGHVTGVNVGTSIVTILHPATNTSKTITVSVIDPSSGSGQTKTPKLVLNNTLNSSGELEVVLGGKVELKAAVEGYSGDPKITFSIKDTKKAVIEGTSLKGIGVGKTTLTISTNIGQWLNVTVNVVKAPYIDGQVNLNIDQIREENNQKDPYEIKMVNLELNKKYKINASGLIKDVDLDNFFDQYFTVSADEKYISYLGNGIIRANYPGKTVIYVYKTNGKFAGAIYVNIPYPTDFFHKLPGIVSVPFNRTIKITFNQDILDWTITPTYVFVQERADGNGENLTRYAYVTRNILNVIIPLSEEDNTKSKTVHIFILPDVKSESGAPLYKPLVIPVTFVK